MIPFVKHSSLDSLKWVLLFLFLIGVNPVFSQQKEKQNRKKIGLVLSGGGAKGLAHIGALKVIEKAGIQIDYIGGTSMGAIIGALYASGYSATELDSLFRVVNFGDLIQDNLPRSAKTFYEKEDAERYTITLPFDNFKVKAPSGFSGGQNIYNELVRLLYHVKDVTHFNELPIPFVCIATNIETGKQVVLKEGYLPEAIMASGTLPSLFEPSYIADEVLIDGGVINNYPIDEVLSLGADVVIGVDVQYGLSKREELQSATDILMQINNYHAAKDMQEKAARTDIYINPKVETYSLVDFNKVNEIMLAGEKAAEIHLDSLHRLGSNFIAEKQQFKRIHPEGLINVNRLLIQGNSKYTRGYVKGKLRFSLEDSIPFTKLEQGIGNLAATGNFKAIRYKLIANQERGEDLILKLDETPNTSFLRLGAHFDNLYKSAALVNFTKRKVLSEDDVISFDLMLGENLRYNFEYYLDKGSYWSFGVNSRINSFHKEVSFDLFRTNFRIPPIENINAINLKIEDFTNQVYLQTAVKEEFAFKLGAEHKHLRYSTTTFREITDTALLFAKPTSRGVTFFENASFGSLFGELKLDTFDDKYFPKKGLFLTADMHYYIVSSDYTGNFKDFSITRGTLGMAFPLVKNVSVNIETELGFKLGTSPITSFDFVLGGFGAEFINNYRPFVGYDFLSLPGNSFVKASARLDYEFSEKHHALFTANFANIDDDLYRTGDWFTTPNFSGYGIGYGWASFLGPVNLLYSWSPETELSQFFVSVGYRF